MGLVINYDKGVTSRKNLYFLFLIATILFASCGETEGTNLESIEQNFMASCANSVDDEIETDANLELDNEEHVDICQCVSDTAIDTISQEDLDELNEKLLEEGEQTLSKEMIDIVADCAIDVMSL